MTNYNVIIAGNVIPGFRSYADAVDFAKLYTAEDSEIAIRTNAELADELNKTAALAA